MGVPARASGNDLLGALASRPLSGTTFEQRRRLRLPLTLGILLADAEMAEDVIEDVVGVDGPHHESEFM